MNAAADPYIVMLAALVRCTFLPASWDKRFVNGMFDRDITKATDRQRATIVRLVHRYRRQIPTEVIMLAQDCAEATP